MVQYVERILTKIMVWYEWFSVHVFGYTGAVHFEEVVLLLSGACIGAIISAMFVANFVRKIYKIDDMGQKQISMTRITVKGKTWYTVKFTSFLEAFQQVILLAFSPPFTIGRFTKRDKKRTIRFIIVVGILMFVLLCFAVLAIVSVFSPDDVKATMKMAYSMV